jgi:type VI secretion system protein ImpA
MSIVRTAPPPVPLPDLESLLAPISADNPSGPSLRFEGVYDEIKRLREEDDATLPQGIWQRELKRADWPGVAALTSEALATRSKDLQLAAWLTEAWSRMYAFAGLAHGLRLITALCDAFWETLHPGIDEESVDARMAPIAWLSGDRFLFAIKSIPITAPVGDDAQAFAWNQWEVSRHQPSQANVLVSASLTSATWFAALSRDASAAISAIDALKTLLTERLGEADAPTLSPLRNILKEITEFVARVRQNRPDAEEVPAMDLVPEAPFDEPSPLPELMPSPPGSPISNRADAYQRLREASDFLLRTEPHSPVPYLVRRAISWGNMSLAEVLDELLHKNADLATIYTLLGIKETEKIKGR